MADYKQLCVELLAALENEGYAHWTRHTPDEDELCLRARAELAEPEPEGPTLDEIDDLCAEHSFCYEDSEGLECLLLIITDALARWGK